MIRYTYANKLAGIEGVPIKVECEVANEGIGIHLVGLADVAVKESLLRTVTALQAYGYRIPGKRVVINLSPADLHKSGCGYDLAIALSVIAASGQDESSLDDLEKWLVVGELSLDGHVRAVPGCVQALEVALTSDEVKGLIVPKDNAPELVPFIREGVEAYGVETMAEAIAAISGHSVVPRVEYKAPEPRPLKVEESLFEDRLLGNVAAQRGLVIAAAGGHHLLAIGVPGSGKSVLFRALAGLLPPMTPEERLSVAKNYSAADRQDELRKMNEDALRRPARGPHYSASLVALLGGGFGDRIVPGEVSLAHEGVLSMDEMNCLPNSLYQALGGVLDNKQVSIPRLNTKYRIPARVQMVSSLNPCPCGYHGDGERCTCSDAMRKAYLAKALSNELYRHSDVQVEVHPFDEAERAQLKDNPTYQRQSLLQAREDVARARELQKLRNPGGKLNADLTEQETFSFIDASLSQDAKAFLDTIAQRLDLPSRSIGPILRMARTVADLYGSDEIQPIHIAQVTAFRFLDRKAL